LGKGTRALLLVGIVAVLAAYFVASATAGPKSAFAPETGVYSGTSVVKGEKLAQKATVSKKGSKYSIEMTVNAPAECEDAELGISIPLPVSSVITMPVDDGMLSYKGNAIDQSSGQIGNKYTAVTLDGHFQGTDALTATVTVKVAAEGGNPNSTYCKIPPVTVKLKKG
jgi:hypothetical protein